MRRAFEIDVLACPDCTGHLRLIAMIYHPRVIRKTLAHVGHPNSGQSPAPAHQSPPLLASDRIAARHDGPSRWRRSQPQCHQRPIRWVPPWRLTACRARLGSARRRRAWGPILAEALWALWRCSSRRVLFAGAP